MFFPDWSGRGRARLGVLCILAFCLLLAGGCGSKQKKGQPPSMPSLIIPGDEGGEPLTHTERAAFQHTARIDRDIHKASMPDVVLQYKHFLRKGRGTMSVFSRNAEPYLGYARKVFRSRGMPEELAYLALVESGYRPDAESRVGALGAWQFMPYTGMKYGLTQDWWLDERLDPYRATEAAADYLQKLYGDFRDWPTAIAAYNAGEGKMSRAKEGTGARNFYEVVERNHKLDEKARLRPETVQYVPRFLAMSKIMRNLPQLGFTPVDQDKPAPVRRLTARPGTDLIALSRACGLSWESFQNYNLHHKRTISSTERSTFVYVPVQNEAQAQAFLRSSSASAFANWRPTKVQTSSDSLDQQAQRRAPGTHPGRQPRKEEDLRRGYPAVAAWCAHVAFGRGRGGRQALAERTLVRSGQAGAQQARTFGRRLRAAAQRYPLRRGPAVRRFGQRSAGL